MDTDEGEALWTAHLEKHPDLGKRNSDELSQEKATFLKFHAASKRAKPYKQKLHI